jgi:stage V sporulation protein G
MKITQVKFYELNKDKLKAFANITLDDELVVSGLKVMDSINGYFVAMPSRKNNKENDGSENYKAYIDTVYPITKEARKYIQDEVLIKYRDFMESNQSNQVEPSVPYPEKSHAQQEEDRRKNSPSIDVSEDLLPF